MAFDGITIAGIAAELRDTIKGGRIYKIAQPENDELLLTIKNNSTQYKLLLSADASLPLVYLTQTGKPSPMTAPGFCMLLRKHLCGGRIAALLQPPAERSVTIVFDCTDEMGVACRKQLVLELMGRNSNLILTDGDGRIVDCLRRVDLEMSEARQVLPGLFYREPPRQNKYIAAQLEHGALEALLLGADRRLDQWLTQTFAGISPLIARELSERFCGRTDADMAQLDKARLADYLSEALRFAAPMEPTMLLTPDETPADFTFRPIIQYGEARHCRVYPSFSALLDAFYGETERAELMRRKSQTLRKTVTTLHERAVRKLETQRMERTATLDRERLRRMGDIVTANLHRIGAGQTVLHAEDFYDPDGGMIDIPLRPELSAQRNAARYYKEYAKAKHAEQVLTEQIARGEAEENYLASVLEELSRAQNEGDLAQIRAELKAGGYIRRTDRRKERKTPPSRPAVFTSDDGLPILVGRNHLQNEELTFRMAHKGDQWLHVQKFHGAHVVIRTDAPVPDRTITQAAQLAALFSEAREGQNVAVDVTSVRCLKRPNGAKPGMVVYERYRTVLVTPDPSLPDKLK